MHRLLQGVVFMETVSGIQETEVVARCQASILDSNGVCVRSGNHCAQPLLRYLGMDSTCRASFSIYNTKEDVDNLVEALKKAYKMFEKYINKE